MRPLWVAELGTNHNGSLRRAVDLVHSAHSVGFGAVKVQAFRANRLYRDELKRDDVRAFEMSMGAMLVASEDAHRLGMKFGATVFDAFTLHELLRAVPVDFLKIASYSLLDLTLIRAVAHTGKSMMMGTGMSTAGEVKAALTEAFEADASPVLLHCVSCYPIVDRAQCNLSAMGLLPVRRGLSDHSVMESVVLRAVHRWQAEVVELHYDMDSVGNETAHSWLPNRAKCLIRLAEAGIDADGIGNREPQRCEIMEREWRADPSDGLRPRLRG